MEYEFIDGTMIDGNVFSMSLIRTKVNYGVLMLIIMIAWLQYYHIFFIYI